MAKELVSQLLYLLDDAFEGPDWHSLLSNLASVNPDDWEWLPPGGGRSICELVRHVGGCKFMYHNQAFGDAQMKWDDPIIHGGDALASIPTSLVWLRAGHERLHHAVSALNDDDLLQLRPHHMGTPRETRWIIMIMMQHDLYHAGEINHIRALHQQNDY